jgi:hypothetical protein
MKKILFLISLVSYGCSNSEINKVVDNETLIKKECEIFLISNLKDPSSYQNISIEIVDSINISESLEQDMEILYSENALLVGFCTKAQVDSVNDVLNILKNNSNIDSLKYISVAVKYRAKNSFGALDIENAILYYFNQLPPSGNRIMIYSNK